MNNKMISYPHKSDLINVVSIFCMHRILEHPICHPTFKSASSFVTAMPLKQRILKCYMDAKNVRFRLETKLSTGESIFTNSPVFLGPSCERFMRNKTRFQIGPNLMYNAVVLAEKTILE